MTILIYVAAVLVFHAGIVNSMLLTSGRIRPIGEPKSRSILFDRLNLIGIGLAVSAGLVLSVRAGGSALIVQLCVAVVLMFADIFLVWKMVTRPLA